MTLALTVFLFGIGAAACGDDNNNIVLPDLAGRDMSMVSGPDMTAVPKGCNGFLACLQAANTADDQQACIDNSTQEAQDLLQAAEDCIDTACNANMDPDAGAARASCIDTPGGDYTSCTANADCTSSNSCSMGFCRPSGVCQACVTKATGTGGTCNAAIRACAANRP